MNYIATPSERRYMESHSLMEAVIELLPCRDGKLREDLRAEWGEATDLMIDRALTKLLRSGKIKIIGYQYIAVESQ